MTPYNLYGDEFNVHDVEGAGFNYFKEGCKEANDTGPYGAVEEMKAFVRLSEGKKFLVDVGACHGAFSLVFTRNPEAVAYAIEPSPKAFDVLQHHISINPGRQIVPVQRFAGETTGRKIKCGQVWHHLMANYQHAGEPWVEVEEQRLDDMAEIAGCDILKVDVEAYECAVLRGGGIMINRFRPIIFLEAHCASLHHNGETVESLLQIINDLNYRMEHSDGSPCPDFSYRANSMTRVICFPK